MTKKEIVETIKKIDNAKEERKEKAESSIKNIMKIVVK